jgi:quercetin dioxygenase-like cupin family protein
MKETIKPLKKYIPKPWGSELIWAETRDYVGKLITINHGHKLSRQYHNFKEETIFILTGTLILEIGIGKDIKRHELRRGENFHIQPGLIHRFVAECGTVEIMEVSTTHLEDVVRLEDDYDRV